MSVIIRLKENTMIWTTDKPTKAGWYWHRQSPHPPEIVLVYIDYTGNLSAFGERLEWITDSQWAGPIPEPEEQP